MAYEKILDFATSLTKRLPNVENFKKQLAMLLAVLISVLIWKIAFFD